MGALIWHDWARLLALTSGAYVAWAALWGLVYRKYFWDFVGGRLGPHGIVPPPQAALFEKIIVELPVLQIVNIVNGLVTFSLEWPLPVVKKLKVYGSIKLRLGLYLWSAFVAAVVYQTAFASLFYLTTLLAYARALRQIPLNFPVFRADSITLIHRLGESIVEVKTVEGRRGRV
ncbi:hypothetical protein NBRC10512_004721 [Rhodotorula toruloides]|uniref:RHTO0S09e00254g1_1 n=2 Tax=Rhodotorula toruloides TaxID=5286 RepID=A0A061B8B5_RHOTO|nr:PRO41 protein [Rhodotorula toruloides NP11]EMS23048.1 PRO41 protein [Rhodotorula toruloides NP11]CDR44130.1 RHTO0S09e00254g1_1 [Rhodotorula toruloides]